MISLCTLQHTGQLLTEEQSNNVALALSRSTLWDTYRTLFWADFDLSIFEMEDRRFGTTPGIENH